MFLLRQRLVVKGAITTVIVLPWRFVCRGDGQLVSIHAQDPIVSAARGEKILSLCIVADAVANMRQALHKCHGHVVIDW
ncbi:MAG: hypothetical protein GPOALKHO_000304 [Sodalis sp.]|nr:MAG: hypothetical protein GPOALKHO_000304 [Sodalis sp.]